VRFHHPLSFTVSNLAWSMLEFQDGYYSANAMDGGLAALK
jgi:hypothetical protein